MIEKINKMIEIEKEIEIIKNAPHTKQGFNAAWDAWRRIIDSNNQDEWVPACMSVIEKMHKLTDPKKGGFGVAKPGGPRWRGIKQK